MNFAIASIGGGLTAESSLACLVLAFLLVKLRSMN